MFFKEKTKNKYETTFGFFLFSPYLAVFGWDSFTRVSVGEAVDAMLELLSNQSTVFPAALRIRQAHPLAKVLWLVGGGGLVTMSWLKRSRGLRHCKNNWMCTICRAGSALRTKQLFRAPWPLGGAQAQAWYAEYRTADNCFTSELVYTQSLYCISNNLIKIYKYK